MKNKEYNILTAVAMVLMLASAIVCLYMGRYLHPFADDYAYGADAHQAFLHTRSVAECLGAAWQTAMHTYRTWQGTYTACFLMSLQPGVFGCYWVTPLLLLGSLVASTCLLMHMLMRRVLRAPRREYVFVATVFVLITTQFVYSPYDAFYWYNGGMYYTLFYSLSLLLASLLLAYPRCGSKTGKVFIAAATFIICIVTGGGNFVSGFATATVLSTAIALYTISHRRLPTFSTVALLVFCAAFALSAFAPGNAFREADERMAHPEFTPSILLGIATSILRCGTFTLRMAAGMMPLAFLVLLPAVWRTARRSPFAFAHPWLCIIITFALYCSVFFPHCYATDYVGPNRVRNVYSYALFWLILINMFYLSGTVARRQGSIGRAAESISRKTEGIVATIRATVCRHRWTYVSLPAAVLLLATLLPPSATSRNLALLGGTIQQNDREMNERERLLEQSVADTVILQPLGVALPSDAHADAKPAPGDWVNDAMARYYGKRCVFTTRRGAATSYPESR